MSFFSKRNYEDATTEELAALNEEIKKFRENEKQSKFISHFKYIFLSRFDSENKTKYISQGIPSSKKLLDCTVNSKRKRARTTQP